MNVTTDKSYNGYTVGYCCACAGTGTFQREYASGACFRCSGTGYVSEQDAKRNWIHDIGSRAPATKAGGNSFAPTYGTVVFAGVTMTASKSVTGQVRIVGKSGEIIICEDGEVICSDGIPKAKRAELSRLASAAAATFSPD